jgi:hypothetical protein
VVELNARITLGSVAIALVRRGLAPIVADRHLGPGDRIGFHFGLDAPPAGWPESTPDVSVVPLWRDGDPLRPALVFGPDLAVLEGVLGPASAR